MTAIRTNALALTARVAGLAMTAVSAEAAAAVFNLRVTYRI